MTVYNNLERKIKIVKLKITSVSVIFVWRLIDVHLADISMMLFFINNC